MQLHASLYPMLHLTAPFASLPSDPMLPHLMQRYPFNPTRPHAAPCILRAAPQVRGVAMNPVDHPHGGKTPGGRPSCTPWGVYCKVGH